MLNQEIIRLFKSDERFSGFRIGISRGKEVIKLTDEEWVRLGSLLDEARNLYDLEDYDKAIDLYHKILQSKLLEYSNRATVMAELGYCYHEICDYEEALDKLQLAKELDGDYSTESGFLRILGSCLYQLGKYEEAIIYQEKALSLSAKSEEKILILFQLGRSHIFAGEGRIALKYFKEYLNKLPLDDIENRMDAMYNIGFAYILRKKGRKAKQSFQFLIDHNRNSEDMARGYYGLTSLSYHTGRYKDVTEFGQKVLNSNAQFSERETILFYMIIAFSKDGNDTQATKLANKFMKDFPNSKHISQVKTVI